MNRQALAVDAGYAADDAANEMADMVMTAEAETRVEHSRMVDSLT